MKILAEGDNENVHLAVSKDGFRQICLQGHPEYDMFSLLKEYKRDVNWYQSGQSECYPPFPANYFGPKAQEILEGIKAQILEGNNPDFPEEKIEPLLENTWADSARSFMASWMGHVYQTTHMERTKQFMDGVDAENPLGV